MRWERDGHVVMENLIVAFSAVAPLIIFMLVGYGFRKKEKFDDSVISNFNKLIFQILLPVNMLMSVYRSDIKNTLDPRMLFYAIGALLTVYVIGFVSTCAFVKENRKRGAMIQALYRSNFLLLGVPIVENIYGTDHIGMPLLLSAFIIPIYNVLAVFTLETFRGNRHGFHPGTILMGIIKNPMIIGAILGFALKLLPPMPPLAVKTLRQLAACTTPVALVVLGASFNFSGAVKEIKEVAFCVVGRLLIAPFLTLGGAILIGIRGIPLASIMAMTITPCAVASFAMAQQMDSDGELAGNALVFTTIFSALTMFLWVYVLKEIGVL